MSFRVCMGVSVVLMGLVGCEQAPPASSKTEPAASATSKNRAVMDQAVENAVQSAVGQPGAAAANGPPPSGVFQPGEADRAHAPGAASKMIHVDTASQPRMSLQPTLAAGKSRRVRLTLAELVMGRGSVIEYELMAQLKAPADDAAGKGVRLSWQIKSAKPSKQAPQSPEVIALLATLAGTSVEAELDENGGIGAQTVKLGKKTDPKVAGLAQSLAEVLAIMIMRAPGKEIGAGGSWMVSERAQLNGVNSVRYRNAKVESVEGGRVTLTIDVRQYATDPKQLPAALGAPAGMLLAGYSSFGKATVVRAAGEVIPISVQLKLPAVMQLGSADNPQQAKSIQFETVAQLETATAGKAQ